jgi:hypothetical protein
MGLVKTNATARVWKGGGDEDEMNDTAFREDRRGLYRERKEREGKRDEKVRNGK